jgi:hypothetical protein
LRHQRRDSQQDGKDDELQVAKMFSAGLPLMPSFDNETVISPDSERVYHVREVAGLFDPM